MKVELFSEMETNNKVLLNEPNFVVCSPFFQKATPGTQKKACKIVFKGGWGFFCKNVKYNETLSNEFNFVVCSPLFQQATPGRTKCLVNIFLKRGLGHCFSKLKSYIICYRMNSILSFAPPFFNRLPSGRTK